MLRSVKDMLGSWRAKGQPDVDTDLANDFFVFDVVCMEGTECMLF
jgi:hypothetical protein